MAARAPTIRSRLALVVVACVMPAALLASALIGVQYQRERDQLVQVSMATTRAMALALDRELAGAESALFALATSPYLQSGALTSFDVQARYALRDLHFDKVALSDANGVGLVDTVQPVGAARAMPPGVSLAKRVFETDRPLVSGLVEDRGSGRHSVVVTVPVRRGETVIYGLSAGIAPERFANVLMEQRLPPGWIGAIFDGRGRIVARTQEMARFIGKPGSPALMQRIAQTHEDALETTTLDGVRVISVFHRSERSGWTVAVGIPVQMLHQALWQSIGWLVAATVLVLMVSLAMAWTVGGRVARSVQALKQPAVALGFGEAVTVPPLGLREADEVGVALSRAATRLHRAEHDAQHDALTGLANRALFETLINDRIAVCQRTGKPFTVLFIDLDGFKSVNDIYGHSVGDQVLRAVALRMKAALRVSDVSARLGGDEFASLLFETGVDAAGSVAAKLVDVLSQPYPVGTCSVLLSASIGVAAFPQAGDCCEQLLHRADEAMYRAKTLGKRRFESAH